MKAAIALCALVVLAACTSCPSVGPPQTVVETRSMNTGGGWTKTITASPDGTTETKWQIIAHNDARAANCSPMGN